MTPRIPARGAGQRGVSLIEALAALAVMAFGLLGVVGMQATLRASSDSSKQRAEAVRLVQAQIEDWRAFEQLGAAAGADYGDIVTATRTAGGSNATFTISASVAALPASAPGAPEPPKLKTVTVDATWRDRTDQLNSVRLASTIAGIAPALGGALGLPADRAVTQRPRERHLGVPPAAVDILDSSGNKTGFSSFTPPGAASGVSWTFSNTTGLITSLCSAPGTCTVGNHQLLAGFMRFATVAPPAVPTAPTGADSDLPAGPAFPVEVQVNTTLPSVATTACFEQLSSTYVAYYCAVPTTTVPPFRWSGQSRLVLPVTHPQAAVWSDVAATSYKVCRYTPVAACQPNVGDTIWGATGTTASCSGAAPTPSRTMTNAEHPLNYTNVMAPLTLQNFLVIHAGDGSTSFACPGDGPAPGNSHTEAHQPP